MYQVPGTRYRYMQFICDGCSGFYFKFGFDLKLASDPTFGCWASGCRIFLALMCVNDTAITFANVIEQTLFVVVYICYALGLLILVFLIGKNVLNG